MGLAFVALGTWAHGQGNWEDVGMPYQTTGCVQIYTDSAADRLIAVGNITITNDYSHPVAAIYNGSSWTALSVFEWGGLHTTVRYGDTLVFAGYFQVIEGVPMPYIAAYYDSTWHDFGTFDQVVRKLKVIDDTLYAVGGFLYVDGHLCNGVARRVGGQWENIGTLQTSPSGPILVSVEKYQDRLYVGGSLSLYDGTNGIAMYDGSTWSGPGGGILGGAAAALDLAVYNGELYVGGEIRVTAGNAGHGLMRWDGSQWHDVGGSMQDLYCGTTYPGRARSLLVHDGKLLASGGFGCAGHISAQRFAQWDGTNWCGTGDTIPDEVMAMAMYHDTLFLALGGYTVNGDTVPGMVMKWVGGAYEDTCGTVSIAPIAQGEHSLELWPNPSAEVLHVSLPPATGPGARLSLVDMGGRTVRRVNTAHQGTLEIPVADLPDGLYAVRLEGADGGILTRRFLKLR